VWGCPGALAREGSVLRKSELEFELVFRFAGGCRHWPSVREKGACLAFQSVMGRPSRFSPQGSAPVARDCPFHPMKSRTWGRPGGAEAWRRGGAEARRRGGAEARSVGGPAERWRPRRPNFSDSRVRIRTRFFAGEGLGARKCSRQGASCWHGPSSRSCSLQLPAGLAGSLEQLLVGTGQAAAHVHDSTDSGNGYDEGPGSSGAAGAGPDAEGAGPDAEGAGPDAEGAGPDAEGAGPDAEGAGPDAEGAGPDLGPSNVRRRFSICGRAASHSVITLSSLLSPVARLTITTRSTPAGHSSRVARNASRIRRLARLRTTALPTRREAVMPKRGESESGAALAERMSTNRDVDTRKPPS